MSSDMIERIARAIHYSECALRQNGPMAFASKPNNPTRQVRLAHDLSGYEENSAAYMEKARFILYSMRDPTEGMVAIANLDFWDEGGCADDVWKTMIDAALG